mmetsp:Transcript_29480/g.21931  ORF Transcript_29480/g.21931 Transcript_29480/m.21931 type:complete len:218 (-) Transcript_29480:131-784(-)
MARSISYYDGVPGVGFPVEAEAGKHASNNVFWVVIAWSRLAHQLREELLTLGHIRAKPKHMYVVVPIVVVSEGHDGNANLEAPKLLLETSNNVADLHLASFQLVSHRGCHIQHEEHLQVLLQHRFHPLEVLVHLQHADVELSVVEGQVLLVELLSLLQLIRLVRLSKVLCPPTMRLPTPISVLAMTSQVEFANWHLFFTFSNFWLFLVLLDFLLFDF